MIDLTGKKIGKLTVIKIYQRGHYKQENKWLCQCDCGNQKILSTSLLTHKKVTDCGCENKKRILSAMIGKRFGHLTVISDSGKRDSNGRIIWLCQCDCGNTALVSGGNLKSKSNKTISCGCERRKRFLKNGYTIIDSRLYKIYKGIIDRCYNDKSFCYKNYGDRGISVCNEWKNDFINFYNWATSNGYKDNLTIDRINVNGNYEPSNCRWITQAEQATNKRNSVNITYNNETHCAAEWARITGIKAGTIRSRVKKGWEASKVLNKK